MRFLILTQYYPPETGAAQVRLSSVAQELRRSGHEVAVLTGMPSYPIGVVQAAYRRRFLVREEVAGVEVVRTWLYPTNRPRIVPRLASYLSFCVSSLLGAPFVGRPDVVFVESPPLFLAVTASLLAKLFGATWMMNVSDLWPDTVAAMGIMRPGRTLSAAFALERWAYRHARYVVGVTRGICDRLVHEKHLDPGKVLFLPNGVDATLFQPRPRDRELEQRLALTGKKLFLFAGLHGYALDLRTILDAAERLRDRPDIRIGLVGDGPVKPWAVQESATRALANVFFEPPQPLESMPPYWSLATAAVVTLRDLPLFDGARPARCFPAMASGVPVIFAGRGEMGDLLDGAEAGIVVPPEDPDALALAIRRLADESATASHLGRNARALVLDQFTWQQIVQRWLADLGARSAHR